MRVISELQQRAGGTYHDRLLALWAEAAAHTQTGGDAARRGRRRARHRDEHRRAARARDRDAHPRAHVLEAIADPDAAEIRADADRQLDALGITGAGWSTIFRAAL